jgi:ElaB/YqjD/DUF883 family membrane-anchored ribosome-binding protein
MPANAADETKAGSAAAGAAALSADAQKTFNEAAKRFEQVVNESVETIRAQTRAYADTAGQQLDDAQRYVAERVKERPLASAGVALGLGVVIGLLLAGGRRR